MNCNKEDDNDTVPSSEEFDREQRFQRLKNYSDSINPICHELREKRRSQYSGHFPEHEMEEQEVKSLKSQLLGIKQRLKISEDKAEYYRTKYEDLKTSLTFPLTEKTGQQLLSLVAEKGIITYNYDYILL